MSSKKELSKQFSESQAKALIDLALSGEDEKDLMNNVIKQVSEGYGSGPYAIGSSVKTNQDISGEKMDGSGSVSIPQGTQVWIVNPHMGESGTDKLVLLPDGVTKVIVPLKVLGEEEGPGADGSTKPASGKQSTVDGQTQGDKDPKGLVGKGSNKKTAIDGKVQGEKAPKGAPKKKVSSQASIDGQEQGNAPRGIKEIMSTLDQISAGAFSFKTKKMIDEIKSFIQSADEETIKKVEEMFSGEQKYHLSDLHVMLNPEQDDEVIEAFESVNIGSLLEVKVKQ